MSKTKKNFKNNKGGKVIASGGYGCVFDPALKCEGEKKRENGKISKLMTDKHATQEYEEINSIKQKLDKIKNYRDYFLIYDATLCRPSKLQPTDLTEFTSKCTALPKDNITKSNINSKLNEVMSLNIPNGGLPIDDYIYKNGSFSKLYNLHDSLVKLLKKGIIPMNERHIYHNDIKDSNVLVDDRDGQLKTRLIDWGLSTEYLPFDDEPFPTVWRNRPFQFNVPFSVIIFSDDFVEKYTKFIKEGGDHESYDSVKPFVIDYISFWNEKRGAGHYKFINEIFYLLYSNSLTSIAEENKPKIIETEFAMSTIIDYITNILIKFTKFKSDGKLNLREYLDNVFIKNVDIWGFINAYYPFLEMLSKSYSSLNSKQKDLFEYLKGLYVNYLYLTPDESIDISSLFSDLKEIKQLLHEIVYSKRKTQSSSSKSLTSDLAKGVKTRKNRSKSNIFKRKPKQRRFKNPFFLSLK
jgi:serine/threonine protein kinase